MRRPLLGLLLIGTAACAEQPPAPGPSAAVPAETRARAHVGEPEAPPAAPDAASDGGTLESRARTLLGELLRPETREAADARLDALPEPECVALLRAGLKLEDDLALEAARQMEGFGYYLDADESARFVALLLPHLFDEADDTDVEELRSVLGSSELGAVLQAMREHESVAGERSLLGALHRQLRAEHLPALVEMALSRDPLLAAQALDEVGIVASFTNRHRSDVARVFAGHAEPPDATGAIPEELVVALRAIPGDERLDDVRRPMFLWWALRWLRDVEPQGTDDADVLVDLVRRARAPGALDESLAETVQIYAIVELTGLDPARLDDLEVSGEEARTALALARRARRTDEDGRVLRELAAADPLSMALALELDPFMAPVALIEGLRHRKPAAALDWLDEVLRHRFRLRLTWGELPSMGIRLPLEQGLDPGLVLAAARRMREIRGSHAAGAFLDLLARPGGTFRPDTAGPWEDLLPFVEGPRLSATLRDVLANGEERDRDKAAAWLARLRDRESEGALLDWLETASRERGGVEPSVLETVAEWVSDAGRERVLALVAEADVDEEIVVRSELAGIPRGIARPFAWRVRGGLQHEIERADEVRDLLRSGDAVGALLLHLGANSHLHLDGIGHLDDPRVVAHLREWAGRREEGRVQWEIGELAIAGDPDGLRQMQDVVRAGRYDWVDDASGEALLAGGGGTLGFWVEEAESNCCRAVAVKRVFLRVAGIDASEEMVFQTGEGVTLGEWLRWRLGEVRWMTPAAGECALGPPESVRGLVRSELKDRYVPAIR